MMKSGNQRGRKKYTVVREIEMDLYLLGHFFDIKGGGKQ
jgi:hypothetical protein